MVLAGDGVADAGLADVLHPGDEVAHLADPEVAGLDGLGADDADLEHLVHGAGRHHLDPVAVGELAVDDPDVGDHAAVGVVDGVEDQGARGRVGVSDGGRGLSHDLVEEAGDAHTGLGADAQHVLGLAADQAGQLRGVLVDHGAGQVDLVEHRDDVEVGAHGEVEVGERLRLDALRGVDEQHRGLAGLEGARHLVGEVDVARGVDHVEDVVARLGGLVVVDRHRPGHPDGLALDGDAALALDVHPVEVLRPRGALVDDTRQLQHPVGQRRLAVVDVGDDAEVADDRRIGLARLGRVLQGHGRLSARRRERVRRSRHSSTLGPRSTNLRPQCRGTPGEVVGRPPVHRDDLVVLRRATAVVLEQHVPGQVSPPSAGPVRALHWWDGADRAASTSVAEPPGAVGTQ